MTRYADALPPQEIFALKENMGVKDAIRLLTAGGSLRVGSHRVDDLLRMAAAARLGGTQLTIVASYRADDMVQIALAGKGHVTFDVKDAPYAPGR